MRPGALVKNRFEREIAMYEEIHSIAVAWFLPSEFGMIVDHGFSNVGTPYFRILASSGNLGWVRCEKVRSI